MRKWRSLGVDVLIVLAWGALIWVVRDMSSRLELLIFVWATLLAGLLSGRFRIAMAPVMPVVAITLAAIFLPGGCDASARCHDDIPVWLGLVYLVVIAVGSSFLLAFGAFLRQRWDTLPDH